MSFRAYSIYDFSNFRGHHSMKIDERNKELLPSLASKHGSKSKQNGHCYCESFCNAVWWKEERQPRDGQENRGDHVGLDEVVFQLSSQCNL